MMGDTQEGLIYFGLPFDLSFVLLKVLGAPKTLWIRRMNDIIVVLQHIFCHLPSIMSRHVLRCRDIFLLLVLVF